MHTSRLSLPLKLPSTRTILAAFLIVGVLFVVSPFFQVRTPSATNSTLTTSQSNTTMQPPPITSVCADSDAYKNSVKQNWVGGYSWHTQRVSSIEELVGIAKNHGLQVSYGQFTIGGATSPVSLYVPIPNYVYYYPCA